jgi:PAS domain-containing protein
MGAAAAVWRSLLPWALVTLLVALAFWQRALLGATSGLQGEVLDGAILLLALALGLLLQWRVSRAGQASTAAAVRAAGQAFEQSGDALLLLDAQGRLVEVNARAASALGLDRTRIDQLSLFSSAMRWPVRSHNSIGGCRNATAASSCTRPDCAAWNAAVRRWCWPACVRPGAGSRNCSSWPTPHSASRR